MPPLYVLEQGACVRAVERRLIVEKDDRELRSAPVDQVDEVVIFGNATLTTPAMKLLLFAGVDTIFMTLDGLYCGRLVGPLSRHGSLRREQYARSLQPDFALAVARACVGGKLRNLRALLMRYQRTLNLPELEQAIAQISAGLTRAASAPDHASLMGVEGAASAAYFGVFARLLKRDWGFRKRLRRPPPDPVNVLLSFGYTLLAKHLEAAVRLAGLDPQIGFLHEVSYGRPSLALDLMEEFRPIVADSVVLRCLNMGLIGPEDFTPGEDPSRPLVLSEKGAKCFIREYETRLVDEFIHPALNERATYRRCFELQARAMAAAIRTGGPYRPFVVR